MSRTGRFMGGVSLGYVNQAAVTIAGLWLTPFLLSRLGPSDYGLWLTASQLLTYLALLDLGVIALLPREVAYATGRAGGIDQADLQHVIGRTVRLVCCQLPVVAIAAGGLWALLPPEWNELSRPLAVILTAFVVTFPLRLFQALLQGLQDLAFVGGLQLAAWAGGTLLTVAMVLSGWGLEALAVGGVTTQVVSIAGCAWRVAVRFPTALPRGFSGVPWAAAAPHVRRAAWVSIGQVAQVLQYGSDLLIVAKVFGPATVVPYACTQKLVSVLANQPRILTEAAAPALSELRMGATRDKLFAVTSSLSLAMMLGSGAVCAVVLAINRGFVTWWVGADQYGGTLLTGLLLAAMLLRHWNTAIVYSLFSFGHERRLSITTLADGIITIAVSLALVKAVGLLGVPLGFLAGVTLVSLPANLRALARETGVPASQLVVALGPWGARLLVALSVATAVNLMAGSLNLLSLALLIGMTAGLYAALMLPIALRPPLGGYVRRGLEPLWSACGFGRRSLGTEAVLTTDEPGPRV